MKDTCGAVSLLLLWIIILNASASGSDFLGFSMEYDTAEDYYVPSSSSSDNTARDEDARINKDLLDAIPYRHQIVYPIQMRMNEVLADLDTRDPKAKAQNVHYHHTNFEIFMFDHRYKIRLDQNRELLLRGLKQKHTQDSKMQIVEGVLPENCYYQGQIRKVPESLVVVSTCEGIRGVIVDSKSIFFIQPLKVRADSNETQFPHVVIEIPPGSQATCGNAHGMWNSYKNLHQREFLGNVKIMKPQEDAAFENPKFLNLALIADHTLFKQLNGTVADSLKYFIQLANIVDALMKDFRIKIRLVYVEIWNKEDHFFVDTVPRTTLTSFLQYRLETMLHCDFDFAHFLTGQRLVDGKLGMSIPDSICSSRAVAISQAFDVQDLLWVANGIVHMLGHALGIEHDTTETCDCDNSYGCIMGQTSIRGNLPDHAYTWSVCSNKNIRQSILSGLGFCLTHDSAHKPTFDQQCGNGITERSEECDCVNKEECDFTDPCCDSKSCLMQPWAMCRYGDCCYNCTVRPDNQMCREDMGECDVPEFCDGVTGECPVNALVQDGEDCHNGESFCYRGECHPYSSQCKSIWGEGAFGADDNCYEMFNLFGRFNGHCGRNATSPGEYLKCSMENIKCGLLHCANGTDQPLNSENKTVSITMITSHGNNYQCKTVNGFPDSLHYGMVRDGTKCSSGGICLGTECVSVSKVMSAKCPVGLNGLICSGHGKCTTEIRCFCSYDYEGIDCSQRSNRTFLPISQSTTESPPSTIAPTELPSTNNTSELSPVDLSGTTQISSAVQQSDNSTLELIIALSVVVVGALVVLGLCLFCYRRKSPVTTVQKKKKSAKNLHGSLTSFSSTLHNKSHDQCYDPGASRSISFGPLPSYRADKIKKAMRGGLSETESEHSRGDRDSTEIKATQTLPLAKPPEKGILKKHPRSVENTRRTRSRDLEQLTGKRESGVKVSIEQTKDDRKKSIDNTDRKSLLEPDCQASESVASGKELIEKALTANCPADKCSSDDGLDFIDDDDDDDASSSCCSCDEDDKSPSASGNLDKESDSGPGVSKMSSNGSNIPQPELQALFVTATVDEHKKKMRKNITDLLRQFDEFDEQFNSVISLTKIPQTDLSPVNSLDLHAKEAKTKGSYLPNGILQQKEKDFTMQTLTPENRNSEMTSSGIVGSTRENPSAELPDLLHAGRKNSSSAPTETLNKNFSARFVPLSQKGNETNSGQQRRIGQNAYPLSAVAPNPLGLSLTQGPASDARTQANASVTSSMPKTAKSETLKKSFLVEDGKVSSPLELGSASGVTLNPISTVPYRGGNVSGSPRLNRHKPVETDIEQNRSDVDSKSLGSVVRPSGLSSSNKQSISSVSNSEGYHSDRGNTSDEPIIVREIPVGREFSFDPSSRRTSAKTPALLSSPEDIDV